jgi:arylsulfatase A-like enzyme
MGRLRSKLLCMLTAGIGVALLGCTATDPRPDGANAERNTPNILIIVTDDQPLGTFSSLPVTARIFGRQGTKFTNAYATTPTCCPSRATIMVGQYVHNHGVKQNGLATTLDQQNTMQRYLKDAGYFTALAGKYLNTWPLEEPPPFFDRWAMFTSTDDNSQYYANGRWNVDGDVTRVPQYATDFILEKSLEYLEEAAGSERPWFLYLAPTAPHSDTQQPAEPEADHIDDPVPPWTDHPATGEDLSDKPPFVRLQETAPSRGPQARRAQLQALMSVDEFVSALFSRLRELDQERDTLAIFLSDNGYMWGQHGLVAKHYPYSESVRIPLYLRWPGHVAAGGTDERLVGNLDVAPTVLDVADLTPQHTFDGHSLLNQASRAGILLESWGSSAYEMPRWSSLRTRGGQYTEYYGAGGVVAREYYDLISDPNQLTNLLHAGGTVENLSSLQKRLIAYSRCAGSSCP